VGWRAPPTLSATSYSPAYCLYLVGTTPSGIHQSIKKASGRYELVKHASSGQEVETVKLEKSTARTREHKKDKKSGKGGGVHGSSPSYAVSGATVFSMEKFAAHQQIGKYTQEYNSLVFHINITLCLDCTIPGAHNYVLLTILIRFV
jgi:hypothetical protein